jgi:hypothetical protein
VDKRQISLFVEQGQVKVVNLTVYPLDNIL